MALIGQHKLSHCLPTGPVPVETGMTNKRQPPCGPCLSPTRLVRVEEGMTTKQIKWKWKLKRGDPVIVAIR